MTRSRLLLAVAALALLLLAGCNAPAHYDTGGPPDPEGDVVGWEQGIWYNETLPVTVDDGLNDTERRMVVARTTARVEHLRDVEFDDPVKVNVLSRAAYREQVLGGGGADGSGPSDAALLDNARDEALFLVGERADSDTERRETQATQVLGYYAPSRDEIVVIAGGENPVISDSTLAHELVHAYQFRHLNPPYNQSTLEQKNANLGLIEGDASLLDHRYERRCTQKWECVTPPSEGGGGSGGGDGSGTADGPHMGLALLNYFPYSDGPVFVRALQERGGWDAVNDAYADPPRSAAQVISPSKYGRDGSSSVTVSPDHDDEWRALSVRGPDYDSLGMPGITAMFAYPSYDDSRAGGVVPPSQFLEDGPDRSLDPIKYDMPYADGWDGDKLRAYEHTESGELGYVWRTKWKRNAGAREFAAGYRSLLAYWGGERVRDGVWRIPEGESEFADAFAVRVDGDTVTVTNAPSVDALDDVNPRG